MDEISFSPAMLAAVLAGRKTVTRRRLSPALLVQQNPSRYHFREHVAAHALFDDLHSSPREVVSVACPFGSVGAMLRIREAPAILLYIVGIRVEQVRCITESEAVLEGIHFRPYCHLPWGGVEPATQAADGFHWYDSALGAFQALFNSIYPTAWARNEWVWVVEFALVVQQEEQPPFP